MQPLSTARIPAPARGWLVLALLLTTLAAAGCQGSVSSSSSSPLQIDGTYLDEFGTTHVITDALWTSSDSFGASRFQILSYDNANDFLIAQNDSTNAYNPNLFSRFDWTMFNGDLYICQTVYSGADVAAAQAGMADRTNPAAGGCNVANNFPWTNFTPPAGP